jgi:hypothetical protein
VFYDGETEAYKFFGLEYTSAGEGARQRRQPEAQRRVAQGPPKPFGAATEKAFNKIFAQ